MKLQTESRLGDFFAHVTFGPNDKLNVPVREMYCVPSTSEENKGAIWILPDVEEIVTKPFFDVELGSASLWKRFMEADGSDLVFASVGLNSDEEQEYYGSFWSEGFLGKVAHCGPNGQPTDEAWFVIEGDLKPGPFVDKEGHALGAE